MIDQQEKRFGFRLSSASHNTHDIASAKEMLVVIDGEYVASTANVQIPWRMAWDPGHLRAAVAVFDRTSMDDFLTIAPGMTKEADSDEGLMFSVLKMADRRAWSRCCISRRGRRGPGRSPGDDPSPGTQHG